MNENNMNQTPGTGNGYPQSGYQQTGYQQTGYQQSGYPQSQQPIPQSQQPFPQSQQPFPQSAMQYPMTGYAEKSSGPWQIAIISIVAVLIVALAVTLIVVLQRRGGTGPITPPPPQGIMISISQNGAIINGQPASIDSFTENDKAYLKLEDIASTAGYDFVREGDRVKLLSQMELAIIEAGSTTVTLQDQVSKATSSVELLKAPFDKDGELYIYARDLSIFMKNTSVSYNQMTKSIDISINAVGGGQPMGQPPVGQPPMGQPPVGQPMGQPPMGQPPVGQAQAPMGQAPAGQPPQN